MVLCIGLGVGMCLVGPFEILNYGDGLVENVR
jgi:hypothetical protein